MFKQSAPTYAAASVTVASCSIDNGCISQFSLIKPKLAKPQSCDASRKLRVLQQPSSFAQQVENRTLRTNTFAACLKVWLKIIEVMPAKDELGFVHHLDKLAQLCYSLKLKGEALNLHRRSLTLKHDWWGRRHLGRAVNLEGIADICYELGDFETAEFDYMEAITLRETYLLKNFDSMSVIDRRERKQRRTVLLKALTTINSLAQIYADRGSFSECEFQYKRALDLLQTAVVPINQPLIEINALLLKNYRALLIKMNKANRKPALHSAGAAVRMSRSEPQKKKFVSGASYGEKF